MNKALIQKWLDDGLISQEQAEQMLADILEDHRERRSGKFIFVVSVIGAVLLGVSAILFIASNWEQLSSGLKMLILLGATGAAYTSGYILKYRSGEFTRVGSALLFLGALLFGATVMLTAQIYHVNANHHVLVLIWLTGVLPLVYVMRTAPAAWLASGLFFLWLWLLVWMSPALRFSSTGVLLFVASALAVLGLGGLHYLLEGMEKVARSYRIVALTVGMAALFLTTFRYFSQTQYEMPGQFAGLQAGYPVASVLALIALVLDWLLRRDTPFILIETLTGIGLLILLTVFYFFPSGSLIYVFIFNLVFAVLTLLFIYQGHARGDMKIVNAGIFWLAVYLMARYFDWFWGLMDRALFFLVGGVILVAGGIVLEKQRRRIRSSFGR
jgi:uncharacterized membrane protein